MCYMTFLNGHRANVLAALKIDKAKLLQRQIGTHCMIHTEKKPNVSVLPQTLVIKPDL